MTLHFMQPGMEKMLTYPGFYDPVLVALSLFAAFLGSFVGLSVIPHIRRQRHGAQKATWLIFGALALGNGVFAMHFIGMLAYSLPVPIGFDAGITFISIFPALLASAWMLWLASQLQPGIKLAIIGGTVGGAGIGIMHFVGMMAMHLQARMLYEPTLFAISILVAIVLAILAIHARRFSRKLGLNPEAGWGRFISPIIMGMAISGMHYTAMAATRFFPGLLTHANDHDLLDPLIMGIGLVIIFFLLTLFALLSLHLGTDQVIFYKRFQQIGCVFHDSSRKLFLKNLGITLLITLLLVGIATYIHDRTEITSQEYAGRTAMDRVIKKTAHEFEAILFDLKMLASSDDIAEFLSTGSPEEKKHSVKQLEFVAQQRGVYDQIRLLDLQGIERIRINTSISEKTTLVPENQLQNVADQDTFKNAVTLQAGEFHISRFDLNVERGQVEVPHKPTLRFAIPVVDAAGQKRGVLVLNYLGDTVLNFIKKLSKESNNQVYLLDRDGNFLLSPNAEDEWGFMFDKPVTFSSRFPVMWNYMKDLDSGAFRSEQGQFIFEPLTVSLRDELKPMFEKNAASWKVVIHVHDATWSLADWKEHPIAAIVSTLGFILSLIIAWFFTFSSILRRQVEQEKIAALHELEFQKRALDEHAIVSATDVKGNITYVNDKFVAISGYLREELLGHNHRLVKSDEHSPEFYKGLWQTIAQGHTWHGEVRNNTKDGGFYWVRATVVPFLNEQGKPFKYVSIRTDVTAMKALEENLTVAKRQAEAAVQAKSEFLANMSHEIRTPMNAIIGLSHLCLQTHLTARQKDYLRKVHNSATSLLRIINDILDFSKIEAGRMDMEVIDFTLEEVLGNMAAMISLKAQEKKLEFLMETAVDIPYSLMGDPLRLGQILINLTNNAIKFTETGEVAVVTEVLQRDEQRVRLQFTIRDTGIGMTPKQASSLFQAFSQADSSTTRKYGGTGLGLAISKRLVQLMGGDIRIVSEAGVGSQFIFDVELGVSDRKIEKSLIPTTDLRGMKVLAVDDNESARNVISDYLTSFSFKVSKAADGKEAMIAVQEADMSGEPFDLVVMDYMMPEIDGITAAAKMRQELGLIKPPVIIMATAYGEESVVKRAMSEAHVDGFLVKPINQSLLFESIMEAFGHGDHEEKQRGMAFSEGVDFSAVLSGAKILLVEDNEINQQVARELLEQANITVIVAKNGKQAIDLVSKEPFDGVLMDLQMPVMDGITATREIRKNPQLAKMPILAMTANAMSGDRELCLEAGMQDHIAKPVDPGNMFSTLARWVKPATPKPPPKPILKADTEVRSQQHKPPMTVPEISGIDTQAGLRRMGGNVKGYMKLLGRFRNNQGTSDHAIRQALNDTDKGTAELHAHTLKGVAATIGAMSLQDKAKDLESSIKNDTPMDVIDRLLTETSTILQEVCIAIDAALATMKPEDSSAPQSTEETEQSIQRRDALLKEAYLKAIHFDAAVELTLASLKEIPLGVDVAASITKIVASVEHYDFDAAVDELKQCALQLGLDLESTQ